MFDPGIWWCIIFPGLEGCAMGQVLHASATTTEAIRRAIQHSQASLRELAGRYGINPKTVAKWKRRTSVSDLPTGPREPKSTVLTVEDEAVIVAFRRHTLLPLDDCLLRRAGGGRRDAGAERESFRRNCEDSRNRKAEAFCIRR
jgi:transposase-like protein